MKTSEVEKTTPAMSSEIPAGGPNVKTELLGALSSAMSKIKIVAKNNKNKFDNYDFASIDNFLELVNPICAAEGLLFHMQEGVITEFTKKSRNGESSWLRVTFEITVMHTSGQELPAVFRSVEVQRTGAQAFGSAQSYALKQYLRSLLLIPTGDKDDADFERTENGVVNSGRHTPPPQDIKKSVGKNPATRALYTELQQEIDACGGDLDALTILSESGDFQHKIKQLPADWQTEIKRRGKDAKVAAMSQEQQGVAA